jgi:hypothetical protein
LEANSEEAVWLKTAQNELISVAMDDIQLMTPQQNSLMPELLLRDMTPQQVADLLAYLASLRSAEVAE